MFIQAISFKERGSKETKVVLLRTKDAEISKKEWDKFIQEIDNDEGYHIGKRTYELAGPSIPCFTFLVREVGDWIVVDDLFWDPLREVYRDVEDWRTKDELIV